MRVVLDTNVVVSALIWGGTPERLSEAAGEGLLELVTTEALIAELSGILWCAKFSAKLKQTNLSAADIVGRYRELAEVIEVIPVEKKCGFAIPMTQRCFPACSALAQRPLSPATMICMHSEYSKGSLSSRRQIAFGALPLKQKLLVGLPPSVQPTHWHILKFWDADTPSSILRNESYS